LLLSDHSWLWARNFRGGGPHLDLLRRTGHWLMKEPELEEEALRAHANGNTLILERQTMANKANPVTLVAPSGETQTVALGPVRPGLWRAVLTPTAQGLYRANDGSLSAFASLGPANPREFQNVMSTTERLAAFTAATSGSVRRIATHADDALRLPNILSLNSGARFSGSDFIALRKTDSAVVLGLSLWPIFAGLGGLALLAFGLLAGWIGEGRGFGVKGRPNA
jgi:hypothetical protein